MKREKQIQKITPLEEPFDYGSFEKEAITRLTSGAKLVAAFEKLAEAYQQKNFFPPEGFENAQSFLPLLSYYGEPLYWEIAKIGARQTSI